MEDDQFASFLELARSGELEGAEDIVKCLENLSEDMKRVVILAMNYSFDKGYDAASDDWGRP